MNSSKKETILVTGGAGFIGSHLVDLLLENNYKVIVIDNLSSGKEKNVNKKAKNYFVDITGNEISRIIDLEKPDYACHLAAQISVSYSVRNPKEDAQNNIIGLLNILESAEKNKLKGIVFASSGGTVYGEPEKLPICEDVQFSPSSPYGIAKMTSEYYLKFYQSYYGLNYIALRYGNVYGPRQDPYGEAGVIAIFIQKMLNNRVPVINGDGEYIRDYVYVEDVANACLSSIKKFQKTTGAELKKQIIIPGFNSFNIGTGQGISVNKLFYHLKKIIGFTAEPEYGPPRSGDLRKNILNCQKSREYLDWKAEYNIEEGLKKTVEWFSNNLHD